MDSKYKKEIKGFEEGLHEPIQDYEREEMIDLWADFMTKCRNDWVTPQTSPEWQRCVVGPKVLYYKLKMRWITLFWIVAIII